MPVRPRRSSAAPTRPLPVSAEAPQLPSSIHPATHDVTCSLDAAWSTNQSRATPQSFVLNPGMWLAASKLLIELPGPAKRLCPRLVAGMTPVVSTTRASIIWQPILAVEHFAHVIRDEVDRWLGL